MGQSIESLVSFNAGEWSQTLANRVDQAKYRAACIQQRNMLALKTGPSTRRPGTQAIATCKAIGAGNYCVRPEDFQFGASTTFVLEWGHLYVRFYSNGAQVQVDPSAQQQWNEGAAYDAGDYVQFMGIGYLCILSIAAPNNPPPFNSQPQFDATHWKEQVILEVPTPYSALVPNGQTVAQTEVFQMKVAPINDVIYITHPNHPRGKLIRISDQIWKYQVVQDLIPALLDENATDTTIAASSATGSTNLSCSAPTWVSGTYYEIDASVVATVAAGVFNIGQTYTILVHGTTDFTLIGSANNTVGTSFVATGAGTGTGTATSIFVCLIAHVAAATDGTFQTDLNNGLWAYQPIFQAGHVGSYWEISRLRASAYIEYDGTAATGFAAGVSASITAFGAWQVLTYGIWYADVQIQSSTNGGATWQTVMSLQSRNDANFNEPGTAVIAQLYRIVVSNVGPVSGTIVVAGSFITGTTYIIVTHGTTDFTLIGAANNNVGTSFVATGVGAGTGTASVAVQSPSNPRIVFQCVDAFLYGIVQIDTVADAFHATATVITQLTVADSWISGFAYSAAAGDRVGYLGINYLCIVDVQGSTAPPSDSTHWLADGWPTVFWSEGAFSAVRGYPATITVFEQRVWLGSTAYEPQRIWGTQTDDIENFDLGDQTLATDGVAFDLDAVGDGSIVWMQSQDALFIGMVEAEWVVAAADGTSSIGPTNVTAHRQSRWGSNAVVGGVVVGDALLFVQRQAFSVRQMLFSVYTNKYMSQDITALSDGIMNGGALQLAYQKQGNKNGFVWATTANGEIVAMTYELDQEVFGWTRHFTGLGIDTGFEGVCVIQGQGTNDDEVWVVVNRKINGASQRFMERLNPINWQTVTPNPGGTPGYLPDKNQACFVDCSQTYTNPTTNIFGGLGYLYGRTVDVCINAQDYGTFVIASQAPSSVIVGNTYVIISLGNTNWTAIGDTNPSPAVGDTFVATGAGSGTGLCAGDLTVPTFTPESGVEVVAQIGLLFTSTLQPMNLDLDAHLGVTHGIKKKVAALTLGLLNTLGCKVWCGDTNDAGQPVRVTELVFRKAGNIGAEPQLFTGFKDIKDMVGSIHFTIPVIVFTDGPLPLTVRNIAVSYEIPGRP